MENNKIPQDILDACKALQNKRIKQDGGDSLSTTYQKFQTSDSTGGYPEFITRIHRNDDHPLVLLKEAVILAGQEVGQKITSRLPEYALLYRQPKHLHYDSTVSKVIYICILLAIQLYVIANMERNIIIIIIIGSKRG